MSRKAREKRERRELGLPAPEKPDRRTSYDRAWDWIEGRWAAFWEPQPVERLVAVRILVPLAILGFVSSRVIHADEWIGTAGFHVPDLGGDDYRQPLYLAPLSNGVAWTFAVLLVASGLATIAGALTRVSSAIFAVLLMYVALADRLEAFTVTKFGSMLALGLAFTPCNARLSIDRWLRPKGPPPTHVSGGNVRFFQLAIVALYFASGTCKAKGDWLTRSDVIWTQLHDSYQTMASYLIARAVPRAGWSFFQWLVLAIELGAPIWFAFAPTRKVVVVLALGMHAFIGLGFGPVVWFALLMASLLIAGYAPRPWLARALRVRSGP